MSFPRPNDAVVARPIGGQAQASGGVDLAAVWSALRSGKWLILAAVATATIAAVAYSMLVTPTYEANSVVSLSVQSAALPGATAVVGQVPLVSSEIGMLQRSSDLAKRVYDSLEETAESLGTTEFFPLLQEDPLRSGMAWEELNLRMTFRGLGADMISMTATSSAPEEATQLANLYAEEYEKQSRERSRASLVAARTFLETQITQEEEILTELQREWERYSRDRDLVAQGNAGERTVTEYSALLTRRYDVRDRLRQLNASTDLLRLKISDIQPGSASSNPSAYQARIDELNERIATKQTEIQAWFDRNPGLEGNTDRYHPELTAAINERSRLERQLQDISDRLLSEAANSAFGSQAAEQVRAIRAEIESNDRQIRLMELDEQELTRQINEMARQIDRIPSQVFEVEEMELRRNRVQTYLEQLRTRLREYQIAEQAELGFVSIVRAATVPREPVAPDLQGNLIMALLLGTVFGAGLAFLRSAVSNQLQSPDEVEHLGYRLLGVVPSMQREIRDAFKGRKEIEINGRVRSSALVTLHSPWSPAAEHYRLVRTNLQAIARDSGVRVVLVTSPEPADGKTISSVNLAISMAQNGSRTLIIDCDLRKASLARALGVERSPGVGEILTEEKLPDDRFASYRTDIEDLYCLPAGRVQSPPPELLGSETMATLLAEARKDFDVVIVDSPPVLAVTDAVVLAPMCDAAVIIVAANKTSPRGVRTTITTLQNLGVSIAGVVFNQFNVNRSSGGYYDYQYGYAYAEDTDA